MNVRILPPNEWEKILPLYQMSNEPLPDPRMGVIIVAETDEGEVIGMRTLRPLLWAGSMWVDSFHRRQGVATAVQKKVEETIEKLGLGRDYFMFPSTPEAEATVQAFGLTPLKHLSVYRGTIFPSPYDHPYSAAVLEENSSPDLDHEEV